MFLSIVLLGLLEFVCLNDNGIILKCAYILFLVECGDGFMLMPYRNYNYGETGEALKVDLLNHPEYIEQNATLSFLPGCDLEVDDPN